jgi:hypothetical protein
MTAWVCIAAGRVEAAHPWVATERSGAWASAVLRRDVGGPSAAGSENRGYAYNLLKLRQ